MDPAVLIFLLYVMIAHELVCGWMQYRSQAAKPRQHAGPMWTASSSASVCRGSLRVGSKPVRTERGRDWRKSGRLVRKA
ncbi:hypothetical protein MATL_G00087160 [Megalops atlanticus]|uniref:Uncharacterized protein n=1 Tax=Megalops atlanticus TaxID=7932 RepID=A0A9D3Q2Y4_MEGAT|nr:hypothetical protein MATL_G00087160 [Megalops atlanticus]